MDSLEDINIELQDKENSLERNLAKHGKGNALNFYESPHSNMSRIIQKNNQFGNSRESLNKSMIYRSGQDNQRVFKTVSSKINILIETSVNLQKESEL